MLQAPELIRGEDLRADDTTPEQLIGQMLKFDVNLDDPLLAQNLLAKLPGLRQDILAREKEIDDEFLSLTMEQEIAHMNDAEEAAGFSELYKRSKGGLTQLQEVLAVESLVFSESIDLYKGNLEQVKESKFLQRAMELFIRMKNGKFDAVDPITLETESCLKTLEEIEFLRETIRRSSSESSDLRLISSRLSSLAEIYKQDILKRLTQYLQSRGLTSERLENYRRIGSIHRFFDSIKDKKVVEEEIFRFIVGQKMVRQIFQKEDIKSDFLKWLLLLKKQLKNISESEGLFFKIFDDRAYEVFESFCQFVSHKYLGELLSDTLRNCLTQKKLAYFVEFYDIFNESFHNFKSTASKFPKVTTYLHEIDTLFIKYMSPFERDYFKVEESNFGETLDLYYKMLNKTVITLKDKTNELSSVAFVEALKININKEKLGIIITLYQTTLSRTKRNIPSYNVNEKCTVIVNKFFDVMYRYFQDALDCTKGKIVSVATEATSVDLCVYSLLGTLSQDLEMIFASKLEVSSLFSTSVHLKELENKYKVFDSEMKNNLNNLISLLLERLFEALKDLAFTKNKKKDSSTKKSVDSVVLSSYCVQAVEVLENLRSELFKSFSESSRKKIYLNIGNRLVAHLKRTIPTKAYFVAYSKHLEVDMAEYERFMNKLDHPVALEKFGVLQKLVKILSLPSKSVTTYLETSKLSSLETRQTIEAFVECSALTKN